MEDKMFIPRFFPRANESTIYKTIYLKDNAKNSQYDGRLLLIFYNIKRQYNVRITGFFNGIDGVNWLSEKEANDYINEKIQKGWIQMSNEEIEESFGEKLLVYPKQKCIIL